MVVAVEVSGSGSNLRIASVQSSRPLTQVGTGGPRYTLLFRLAQCWNWRGRGKFSASFSPSVELEGPGWTENATTRTGVSLVCILNFQIVARLTKIRSRIIRRSNQRLIYLPCQSGLIRSWSSPSFIAKIGGNDFCLVSDWQLLVA